MFKSVCLIGVCALAPASMADGVIDFENLVVGTIYDTNDLVESGGVTMRMVGNAFARVDDDGLGGGSGIDVEFFGDASFDFLFGDQFPLASFELRFGNYGGTQTLEVNGVAITVQNMNQLPATLGGVNVQASYDDGSDFGFGTLTLTGVIDQVRYGGQETWIDDVAYVQVPAPSSVMLLGAAGVAMRRRR